MNFTIQRLMNWLRCGLFRDIASGRPARRHRFSRFIFQKAVLTTFLCLGTAENALAFWGESVFPPKVSQECQASWYTSSRGTFLRVVVNLVVELKTREGELAERAYFYIDCKGANCVGVRMNGLERSSLDTAWMDPIYPQDIEIISKPDKQPVQLRWQDRSVFTIFDEKTFHWKLHSVLSENTFTGSTICN